MKPKMNYKESSYDTCQTPAYALAPLLPYLNGCGIIWESASGEGLLATALADYHGSNYVIATDILTGVDFFTWEPYIWNIQVTNPPYSIKYEWLKHSFELDKPFALLMPVEMMGAMKWQDLVKHYGITVMLLNRRINFEMPNKGYSGGGAQFPVAWYMWRITQTSGKPDIIFGEIKQEKMG
jgi:hypothetical protein